MSIYTKLEIQSLDGSEMPELGDVSDEILALLEEEDLDSEVLDALHLAFESGVAEVAVGAEDLAYLLEAISELVPESMFAARGLGEDFRSTWVREFANGERIFAAGPWTEED
jgi:hypothetical protein